MTITVTADPLFAPPRNEVEIAVPSGAIMDSVAVSRTASGVSTLLRSQPSAGFTSRTVYDYEAPYGVECTYSWTATYLSTSSLTEVWTEPWASLSAWTASGASWSVSGGRLVWSAGDDPAAYVTRTVTPGRYQITFLRPPRGVARIDFGGFYIDNRNYRIVAGSSSTQFIPNPLSLDPWVIDVTPSSIVLTVDGSSYSLAASVQVTQVRFAGAMAEMRSATGTRWGTTVGTGNGEFDVPGGTVVVGSYIYVVDQNNHRIQKFDLAGAYVTQWGSQGSGNGQFNFPMGIAADASGNLYVTDRFNHRVQKFAPPGSPTNPHTYSAKWGTSGTGDGQFSSPYGVTVDASSNVYVTDIGTGFTRVQKFTSAGVFVDKFGAYGSSDGQFNAPLAIAVDTAGYIYVVDNLLHRVQKFSAAFAYVTQWGSQGSGNGQFNAPTAITIDTDSSIYITEDGNDRIQKFYYVSAGEPHAFASKFGSYGTGEGQFTNPQGIAVNRVLADRDAIYVTDVLNGVTVLAQYRGWVDDVTLSEYTSVPVTVTETSDPVTLTPEDGWLIHPATPGLSFPVHANMVAVMGELRAGLDEIGTIENQSNATVHRILGSETSVVTTNGNRAADSTSITIQTMTAVEETNLKALLRDETPILFNFPPAMGTGFSYAFHHVGTTTRQRFEQGADLPYRRYFLPLTEVQSPIVTQQNVGWSYANVAIAFTSYAQLIAAYNSYADMATDSRNPGF